MKRLNLKLLIGLLVSLVVLMGAAYGIWRFQMKRNSQNFIQFADDARKEGNLDKEAEFLWRYLLYDPDRLDIQVRYAKVAAELGRTNVRRLMPAINACNAVLAKDAANIEMRRTLAELYMRIGRVADAVGHLERIESEKPGDPEVAKLLAECYLAQEEIAKAEELLTKSIEANPTNVILYQILAGRVYQQAQKNNDKAREVIDQMVAANPESWEAYLGRYEIAAQMQEELTAEARADLERALELAPTKPQVAIAAAQRALMDQDFERARTLLAHAREANADSKDLIIAQARLELMGGNADAGRKFFQEGVKLHPEDLTLLWMLAELQINTDQIDDARKLIADLEKYGRPEHEVGFLRAVVLIKDKKPSDALAILNRIRPQFANNPLFQRQIDANRANCFRELGQVDQEIAIYRNMLLVDPIRGPRLELARALLGTGRTDEAISELEGPAEAGNQTAQLMMFQALVVRNMQLPAEQRNWAAADKLIEVLAPPDTEDVRLLVMRAEYLIRKGEFDSAQSLLDANLEKHSNEAIYWLARAELANRKSGHEQAMEVLNQAQQEMGERQEFRLARISLLAQQGTDESKAALLQMANDAEQLPPAERDAVQRSVAQFCYALRDLENAERIYQQVASRPENAKDLGLQVIIFSIQRDDNDDDGMTKTLARIKEIAPEGERNEFYQFCNAAKIVADVQRQKQPIETLSQAIKYLEGATRDRPNWAQALRLRGEIEERMGNIDGAIASFRRAIDMGDLNPQMAKHLAALLLSQGKTDEVQALMERIPNGRAVLGRRIEALLDLAQGDVADAVTAAVESVEQDGGGTYVTQIWLGDVLKTGGRFADAETAYRKAIEMAPDMPEGYVALANFLGTQDRKNEIGELITQIETKVAPEKHDSALAAANEAAGNLEAAEKYLQSIVDKNPTDARVLEALSAFYARTRQNDKMLASIQKLANLGSQATAEEQSVIRNANRNLAAIEANKGTQESIRNALAILNRNANPELDVQDLVLSARLHSQLRDRQAQQEAIRLLRQVLAKEPERPQQRLLLAQLLDKEGNWREAKDIMLGLVSSEKYRNEPSLLANYADMLLRHGEVSESVGYVRRLEEMKFDKDPLFISIKARQLRDQGHTDEAISLLTSQIVRPLSPSGVGRLSELGDQLVTMAQGSPDAEKYLKAAEAAYREYVAERPDSLLVLASFLGQYRSLEAGFDVCQQAIENGVPIEYVVRLGLSLMRAKPDQVTDKEKSLEDQWLRQGLAQDENAAMMNLLLADYFDLINDYDRAANVYAKLKDRTDLTMEGRVTVLNNLAFILAVRDNKGDEALPMIEEAIKLIGPIPELLDTRAMVHLSLGNVPAALADLESALASGPNPVKYFHLARAHLANNNRDAAAEAFDQARNAGLNPKTVPYLEMQAYEQLNQDFPPKVSASTN